MCRVIRSHEHRGIVREVTEEIVGVVRAIARSGFIPRSAGLEGNRTEEDHVAPRGVGGAEVDGPGDGGRAVHDEITQDVHGAAAIDRQGGSSISPASGCVYDPATVDDQFSESNVICGRHGAIHSQDIENRTGIRHHKRSTCVDRHGPRLIHGIGSNRNCVGAVDRGVVGRSHALDEVVDTGPCCGGIGGQRQLCIADDGSHDADRNGRDIIRLNDVAGAQLRRKGSAGPDYGRAPRCDRDRA